MLGFRKKPRQQRAHRTVEIVLQAAAKVFAKHGFAHGTTNRIAAKAGISVGSLYEYFPNKESILLALAEKHVAEGEALLSSVSVDVAVQLPLEGLVRLVVEQFVALHREDRALHRVLFEEAPRPPQFSRRLDDVEQLAVQRVGAVLKKHPEVRSRNPKLAALMVARSIESQIHRWAASRDDLSERQLVDELVRATVAYLAA